MADARLRELERRSAQGDPGARQDLLVERMRAGELSREQLELAAYLGDPDAHALSPTPAPPPNVEEWLAGFHRFDTEIFMRAISAAARVALAGWEAWEGGEYGPRLAVRAALESVARGDIPVATTLARGAALEVLDGTSQLLGVFEAEHGLRLESAWLAHRAGLATVAAARALEHVSEGHGAPGQWAAEVATAVDHRRLRAAVRDALVPWALSPSP